MGIGNVILGVKLSMTNEGIQIIQFHYIEKILKRFGYLKCKPVSTPYELSIVGPRLQSSSFMILMITKHIWLFVQSSSSV